LKKKLQETKATQKKGYNLVAVTIV
jgi:hypothetical protein